MKRREPVAFILGKIVHPQKWKCAHIKTFLNITLEAEEDEGVEMGSE